ncbi:hypothetical protein Tco_0037636 [Tanacetum coccineum]
MDYRASTLTNPNTVIIPAFVEANYEALESLLSDRRRQMRNNDLRIELEVRRRGERTVGFKGAQSRGENRVERNTEGGRPLEEAPRGNGGQSVNLPLLLAAHLGRSENGQPLQSSLTFAYGGQALLNNIGGNLPSNDDTLQILGLHEEQRISGFVHGLRTRSLVKHLSMDLPSTYKGLMEKTYTWVEAREVATNGASSDRRDSFERTTMQRMGILVSTIHGDIKFHTKKGIGTVLSADESDEGTKRTRKILATNEERVLICVNAEEKIFVNDKYPDQTVTIRKLLPEHFKKELQNLLKSNADVFAWTYADMTGILRTIMVEGNPFNTEHKLNDIAMLSQ